MKKLLCLFLSCCSLTAHAQRSLEYSAELTGLASTATTLPMWATTAKNGIYPDSRGGLLHAGVYSDFNAARKIQTAYGFSAAGYLTQRENKAIVDELFVSLKWRKVRLDLGMIHPEEQFNGISSQNGSVLLSTNARTLPGYNLHTEFIDVPLTKGILAFRFNLSDYRMIDKRFVDNVNLHHKSLYLRITPHRRWAFTFGLEHWAQWAGTSPLGKQPSDFTDYLRIFIGVNGGDDATWSDQVNVLGNHLGSRYYRLDYRGDSYTLSAYYDNLFDDDNPLKLFRNAPDGVYGFHYGTTDRKRWVSDVIYEFVYTKFQSGRYHDRLATPEEQEKQDPDKPWYGHIILGGNDNYFNNGEYRSGWTYYGRTIGTPFITPCPPAADGITYGVYNSRVAAHYIGIQGYAAAKIPYRVRLSYSRNYGTYFPNSYQVDCGLPSGPFERTRQQFSFGIEAGVFNRANAPFQIRIGLYGDCGSLYRDNFGITVSLIRRGKIL